MTAVAESRPEHRLYFFRRPADCPIYRLCRPGEFDILSNGYACLPPSIHPDTGQARRWLVPPWSLEGGVLPEVPKWVVDMLKEAATATPPPRQPASIALDGDEGQPPVRLNEWDQEVWRGRHPALKPDGDVDASETLYGIGMMLARNNASETAIAAALAERDKTLQLNKYTDRRDGGRAEYWRIGAKAVQRAVADEGTLSETSEGGGRHVTITVKVS